MTREREIVNDAATALIRLIPALPESASVDGSIHSQKDKEWVDTRDKLRQLRQALDYYFGLDSD